MKRITTRFMMPGPVMTQTVYTMMTQDDAVAAEYTVNMSGTDDAARVWHNFKYTFLKDTGFPACVLFAGNGQLQYLLQQGTGGKS